MATNAATKQLQEYIATVSDFPELTVEKLNTLVKAGANINAVNEDGWNVLMMAAYKGTEDMVRAILAHKPDLASIGNQGFNALHFVAYRADDDEQLACNIARHLISSGIDASLKVDGGPYQHHSGKTAHDLALETRWQKLADAIAYPHKFTPDEATAELLSYLQEKETAQLTVSTLDELLGAGADINVTNANSWSLLHDAVSGDVEMVVALLRRQAKVNACNKLGITPLMEAARSGSFEVVDAIISAGGDTHMVDVSGNTPLMHAVLHSDCSPGRIAMLADSTVIVKQNKDGNTALHLLADNKNLSEKSCAAAANHLIHLGAMRLTEKNNAGQTPEEYARSKGKLTLADAIHFAPQEAYMWQNKQNPKPAFGAPVKIHDRIDHRTKEQLRSLDKSGIFKS